jgi:hypothetical protein
MSEGIDGEAGCILLLTNTGYSTDSVSIIDASSRFNLNTGDDSFVRCFHVGWNIDAVSDGWKR